MAKHNETGIKGEVIAKKFLQNIGYNILHTNWRWEKKEVDIIADIDGLLVFVEVKTRSSSYFGFPEDAVTEQKQEFLKQAAEEYLYQNPQYEQIRFDIISILTTSNNTQEIKHFEDAFF
ncbi:MAG: YraN family protein [Chitinophagales bacterium]|nr:YraN family protein [Chitinophagaceae bacterium]MCB9064221.1 YraN family protein [Chitinophagales bacterium]